MVELRINSSKIFFHKYTILSVIFKKYSKILVKLWKKFWKMKMFIFDKFKKNVNINSEAAKAFEKSLENFEEYFLNLKFFSSTNFGNRIFANKIFFFFSSTFCPQDLFVIKWKSIIVTFSVVIELLQSSYRRLLRNVLTKKVMYKIWKIPQYSKSEKHPSSFSRFVKIPVSGTISLAGVTLGRCKKFDNLLK